MKSDNIFYGKNEEFLGSKRSSFFFCKIVIIFSRALFLNHENAITYLSFSYFSSWYAKYTTAVMQVPVLSESPLCYFNCSANVLISVVKSNSIDCQNMSSYPSSETSHNNNETPAWHLSVITHPSRRSIHNLPSAAKHFLQIKTNG